MPTPAPPTGLDLDALEREGRPELLTLTYRGETFTLTDPYLLDWETFAEVDWSDAKATLKAILDEEAYERFWALKPTENAMRKLSDKLTEYYTGTAPGEADGSPAS